MLSQRTGYARQPPYLWEEQWEGGPAGGQRYEKGAAGGAAVATAGLSILARAAWDRLNRSSNACADVQNAALEALSDRFAELPTE